MLKFVSKRFLLFILTYVFSSQLVLANNPGISYQGRIFKPDGSALEGSAVQFRMQIRSPGPENCLLFEEIQTLNMSGSSGVFSLTLNDGTGTRIDTATYQLDRIFANRETMTLGSSRCTVGTTYAPNTADGRKFIVYFKDESMGAYEPLPILSLNFAPQSMYALESQKLDKFPATSVLRAVDVSGNPITAPAFDSTQLTNLNNLIAGTSTQYATATSFSSVQAFAKTTLPICIAGQVLNSDGTTLSCVTDSAGGSSAYSAISNATGTNSIDNAAWAQTWAWNSATNQNPMTMSSSSLTSGSILNVTSTSTVLNSANGLLNVSNLGSTTAGVLARFQSNSAVSGSGLTVHTSGNVGIGTTNPAATLHVTGSTVSSASGLQNALTVVGTSNSGSGRGAGISLTTGSGSGSAGSYLDLPGGGWSSGNVTLAAGTNNGGGAGAVNILGSPNGFSGNQDGGAINLTAGSGAATYIGGAINITAGNGGSSNVNGANVVITGGAKGGTASDGNVLLANTRGNVGIGTASPAYKLDVGPAGSAVGINVGNGGIVSPLKFYSPGGISTNFITSPGSGSIYTDITMNGSGSGWQQNAAYPEWTSRIDVLNDAYSVIRGPAGAGPISYTSLFTVKGSGNVGIGTSTPAEKLSVNGAIQLASTATNNAGTIRWDGINFQGYNGTAWSNFVPNPPTSSSCDNTVIFTIGGNYNYTVPASFGTITIQIWGGGGGGGGAAGGSNAGGNGGTTSIASLGLSAGGGSGGIHYGNYNSAGYGAGGAGSTASGGTTNSVGPGGTTGSGGLSGMGGTSPFGGAGGGSGASNYTGAAGGSPGGGGAGAAWYYGSNNYGGGGGAGAFSSKQYSMATLIPGTFLSDVIVGGGGTAGPGSGNGTSGGAGGTGRVSITCVTAGSTPANNRGVVFWNAGSHDSATNLVYTAAGQLGIGTPTPQATLHVNGNVIVQKNASEPVACSATYDGMIALTSGYVTCVCKGGSSAWVRTTDGITACSW